MATVLIDSEVLVKLRTLRQKLSGMPNDKVGIRGKVTLVKHCFLTDELTGHRNLQRARDEGLDLPLLSELMTNPLTGKLGRAYLADWRVSHNLVTDEGDALIADQMSQTPAK